MDKYRSADQPAADVQRSRGRRPRTAVAIRRPPTSSPRRRIAAGGDSSVGASSPASHPAMAGISRARTPAPSSSGQRRSSRSSRGSRRMPPRSRLGGEDPSRHGHVAGRSTTGRRNAIGPGNDRRGGGASGWPGQEGRSGRAPAALACDGERVTARGRELEAAGRSLLHLGSGVLEDKQDAEAGRPGGGVSTLSLSTVATAAPHRSGRQPGKLG